MMIETSLICLDFNKKDYLGWKIKPKIKRRQEKPATISSFQRRITFNFFPVPVLESLILPLLLGSPRRFQSLFSAAYMQEIKIL